jgi:hypothetical protein
MLATYKKQARLGTISPFGCPLYDITISGRCPHICRSNWRHISKLFVGVELLTAIESNAAASSPHSLRRKAWVERRNATDFGRRHLPAMRVTDVWKRHSQKSLLIARADNASAGTKFLDKIEDMLRNRLTHPYTAFLYGDQRQQLS